MEEKKSPMPNFYVLPYSTPLYWGNEQMGALPEAVKAYLDYSYLGVGQPLQGTQFALLRDYLRYYIDAPCWEPETGKMAWSDDADKIDKLRVSVRKLKTPEEMREWLMQCRSMGIDPL